MTGGCLVDDNAHKLYCTIFQTGKFVGFYNPRTDIWSEQFKLDFFRIESLTDVGWVTAVMLQFNTPERIASRQTSL
jgi:hypothetical protein